MTKKCEKQKNGMKSDKVKYIYKGNTDKICDCVWVNLWWLCGVCGGGGVCVCVCECLGVNVDDLVYG